MIIIILYIEGCPGTIDYGNRLNTYWPTNERLVMKIIDRSIVQYKDASRTALIDFDAKSAVSVLELFLRKIHDIGYTIDSLGGRECDYQDDEGYHHHGRSRVIDLEASDTDINDIDKHLHDLGNADEYSFSAHKAEQHIHGNIIGFESRLHVFRLLLEYRAEFCKEIEDLFRVLEW